VHLIDQQQWEAYQRRREAQRLVSRKARSPKWSRAGLAVCGECCGRMYCTSSQRGRHYALYCSAKRTSGMCTGTYRTREHVAAAVALWMQRHATSSRRPPRLLLNRHPSARTATRRRRNNADGASCSTDGALDLAAYKRRRADIEHDVEAARRRLAEIDATYPGTCRTRRAGVRRHLAHAQRRGPSGRCGRTPHERPRPPGQDGGGPAALGEPGPITFTKRGRVPLLPSGPPKVATPAGSPGTRRGTAPRTGN